MNEIDYAHTLYSMEDIMRELKCSRNTAYKVMNSPNFPIVKVGNSNFVVAQAFWDWVSKRQILRGE